MHRDDSDIEAAYDAADAAARLEAEAQLAQIAAPIMASLVLESCRMGQAWWPDSAGLRSCAQTAAAAAAELMLAVKKEI